jgi:hypothetical protein
MTDKPVEPVWISKARELFDLLADNAKLNKYGEVLFEGKLRDLYYQTGASNSDYTRIIGLLTTLEVIRFVRRGNRHQTTIIEITGELPGDSLLPPESATERSAYATMVAAGEIRQAVSSLVAWRESLERGGLDLAEVIKNFELRLTRLEREVAQLATPKSKAKKSQE